MNRDDYGFEMVDHDDHDDDDYGAAPRVNGHVNGGVGGKRKKRARELYDAFAEDTEDEEEMFDLGSEESDGEELDDEFERRGRGKEGRYRDDEPLREGVDVR